MHRKIIMLDLTSLCSRKTKRPTMFTLFSRVSFKFLCIQTPKIKLQSVKYPIQKKILPLNYLYKFKKPPIWKERGKNINNKFQDYSGAVDNHLVKFNYASNYNIELIPSDATLRLLKFSRSISNIFSKFFTNLNNDSRK